MTSDIDNEGTIRGLRQDVKDASENRWIEQNEDSELFSIQELIQAAMAEEEAKKVAPAEEPPRLASSDDRPRGQKESTPTEQNPLHNAEPLEQLLSHALKTWRARLARIRRFLIFRTISERGLIASLVLLAGISSTGGVFGDIQPAAQHVLLAVTTAWGIFAATLAALDPFRRAKLYRARLARMISLYEDFRRQLRTLGPSREQVVTIARFAEFSYDLLKPHQDDWSP